MTADYTIVVPTYDRPENMKMILHLFPSAVVVINKSNLHLLNSVVPKKQIMPHPDMPLIETRNWILDTIQTECVLQFNDDVKKLVRTVPPQKTFRDPDIVRGVIENTIQCARDLRIGVFCWTLTTNLILRPEIRPFRASAPCSAHAFGVCGQARNRRFG